MYRPEKPAPTTTASNWSGTEAGLFTRRSLVVPELGKGGSMVPEGYAHPRSVTDLRPPREGVAPSRLACGHQPLPRRSHAALGACWALPLTLTQLHKCANDVDRIRGSIARTKPRTRNRTTATR